MSTHPRALEKPAMSPALSGGSSSPVFPARPRPFLDNGNRPVVRARISVQGTSTKEQPALAPQLAELKTLLEGQGLLVTENGLMRGRLCTLTASRPSISAAPLIGIATCNERRFEIRNDSPAQLSISVRSGNLEDDCRWACAAIGAYLANYQRITTSPNSVSTSGEILAATSRALARTSPRSKDGSQ